MKVHTTEAITENQPKNENGELLDTNTGEVLDPNHTDLGHKPGQEWQKRKQFHQEQDHTRKEFIESGNDPDIYQWEYRSSNRSHKHEKKD